MTVILSSNNSVSAQTIITEAMKIARIFDPNETPDNAEMEYCRGRLNLMLDLWSNEGLMIYARTEDTLTLTVGTGDYTIGAGSDISTVRPVRVDQAYLRDSSGSLAVDYPLDVINQQEYNGIPVKGVTALPRRLYYFPNVPSGTVYFDHLPDRAYVLHLFSQKPFGGFADLTTEYDFPPGYQAAMSTNLGLRLSNDYEKAINQFMVDEAERALSGIKRVNAEVPMLSCGLVGVGRNRYGFNVYTGK